MKVAEAGTDVAPAIAGAIVAGFDRHYRLFRATSVRAKERFEQARWREAQQAVKERIRFYDDRVIECVARLRLEFGADKLDDATWHRVKILYVGLLVDHKRPELAETFFNSVITRILGRTYVHNDFAFPRAAVSTEYIEADPPTYRAYYPGPEGFRDTFVRVFEDCGWSRPFADLGRDVDYLRQALLEHVGDWRGEPNLQVQVMDSPFYRNKAAYVVGKVVNGYAEQPFVVPVLRDERGRLVLDAVLLDRASISILFSVNRAYFMADMDVPSGYVEFLQSILPHKPRAEIYTVLGLAKQGKTLFVRDLLHHLHHSRDLFVEAEGTRGQVMHVFNLPSYRYVFKVIKDVFGPTKTFDRATVKRKFQMAKEVDRVGRMSDTLEFKHLALPLDRFARELLDQLLELAPSTVAVQGDQLMIAHCYVERRLVPLNVQLEDASDEEVDRLVHEYGDAIRELAIANVFTGDMLWRNFGVNRHGRVVFYDFDEIEYLTDCSFRAIPEAPTPEDELSAEVWYPVGRRDVFPEEFETFLLANPRVREAFMRHHAELLRPEYWQELQRQVASGEIVDFFPYAEEIRFCNRFAGPEPAEAVA